MSLSTPVTGYLLKKRLTKVGGGGEGVTNSPGPPPQLWSYTPGQSTTLSRLAELEQESNFKCAFHFELPFKLLSLCNELQNYTKGFS